MLFNNKLFNSIACLLSFTNLQLVIPGRTWILLYLGRTVYKRLCGCLALYHAQVHRYYILNTAKFSLHSIRLITPCSISWIPFICLLEHPSTPASGTLPTEQQYNGHFVNTLFILSTHHCLSLLIAFNTLFLSGLPLFSPVVDVIHL